MNSTHRVNVVRIEEILPHTNADTLGIIQIGGYQVVVKKDDYKIGDLAIYIQPDTVVPVIPQLAFLWADREFADGTVPEKLRRITVRRFRKEWSEGLLMPLKEFGTEMSRNSFRIALEGDKELPESGRYNCAMVAEGDDVAELLGFTHYVEPEPVPNINQSQKQYKGYPKSLRGWFFYILAKLRIYRPAIYGADQTKPPKQFSPVYDVEGFKNYPHTFMEETFVTPGEQVIVTEKIHGSNARYLFDGEKMHVGSHNYWKSEKSTCIWRRALKEFPFIEVFCRMHPGATLYGEIAPTQKGYDYGTKEGSVKFFVFDVLSADGTWMNKCVLYSSSGPKLDGLPLAPMLYAGPFNLEKIKALVEGNTTVEGANHLREGVVISSAIERLVRGLGRAQLKIKSMKFLEKESK